MEEWLVGLEKGLIAKTALFINDLNVVVGWVGVIGITAVTLWAVYQSFLIMAGMSSDPLLPFLKGLLTKSIIIGIASSVAFYSSYVTKTLTETQKAFAKEVTGSPYITKEVGGALDLAVEGFSVATNDPTKTEATNPNSSKYNWIIKALEGSWDHEKNPGGAGLYIITIYIKLAIVYIGLIYLSIVAVMTVFTSEVFFFISILFGPMFLMLAAFESTYAYFRRWFDSTLGYFMDYILILFVWGFMLKILGNYIKLPVESNEPITWGDTIIVCLACFFYAKIIDQVGSLGSNWFGGDNVAHGVNPEVSKLSAKAGGMLQNKGIGMLNGIRKMGTSASNKLDRTSISQG